MQPTIWYFRLCPTNSTARPYGLPARREWSSNIIFWPAQKLFPRRLTLNPKTQHPKALTQNPEPKIPKPWKLWILNQKTLRICSILCNLSYHVRQQGKPRGLCVIKGYVQHQLATTWDLLNGYLLGTHVLFWSSALKTEALGIFVWKYATTFLCLSSCFHQFPWWLKLRSWWSSPLSDTAICW